MKVTDVSDGLEGLVCIADFQTAALAKLGPVTGEYYRGGSDDEVTLKENSTAFSRWKILPRYLISVSNICVETKVLGKIVSCPIGISPTAFQKVAHPKGELATAKAASTLGTIFCQSLLSNCSFDEVRTVIPNGRHWAQIYLMKDPLLTESIIRNAERAGVEALVITVDGPYYGKRRGCLKNPLEFPKHLRLPNLGSSQDAAGGLTYAKMIAFSDNVKNSATWDDIKRIKEFTALPLVLKGILTTADALLALDAGVDAIWISNHGGRQLDTVPATIDVLPAISKAISGRCEIYLDGGVSRGTDVLKALALGVTMVFTGRAPIWGLAVAGEQGVVKVLEILKSELQLSMGLSGRPEIHDLTKSMLLK